MDRVISLLAALVGLIALGGAILVHTNGDAQRSEMASQIAQLKVSVDLLSQQTAGARPAATAPAAPSIPSAEPPISEYVAAETPSSSSAAAPSSASSSALPAPPPLLVASAPSAASSEQPSSSSVAPSSSSAASSAEPDGQIAEVKALQDRIASLEQAIADQASQLDAAKAAQSAAPPSSASSPQVAAIAPGDAAAPGGANPAAIDASGPTKDCIPIGTRFMATTGDNFPICKTKVVVKVAAVSDGFATINGAGDIATGGSGTLPKGCNVMVFSADDSGYAELRVSCQ